MELLEERAKGAKHGGRRRRAREAQPDDDSFSFAPIKIKEHFMRSRGHFFACSLAQSSEVSMKYEVDFLAYRGSLYVYVLKRNLYMK